jgi:hypothetical protein
MNDNPKLNTRKMKSTLLDTPLDITDLDESLVKKLENIKKKIESLHSTKKRPGAFTCAVIGPWGSGKTTVLEAICKTYSDSVTLMFKPWRYEREEHLIVPLMVEFHSAIHTKIEDNNIREAVYKTGAKLVGNLARSVLRAAGKTAKQYIGVDLYEIGKDFISEYGEVEGRWKSKKCSSEVEAFRKEFEEFEERSALVAL